MQKITRMVNRLLAAGIAAGLLAGLPVQAQYPFKGAKPRTEGTRPPTAGAAFFSLSASGLYPFAVAADSSGNLYIAGSVQSNIFPATAGSVQVQYGGGTCINADPHQPGIYPCFDAFVLKLDPTGAIVYATYLGGSGDEFVSAIAADAAGSAYVTGGTTSNDFPVSTHALFPKSSGQGIDGFVAKISPAGDHLEYSTFLPGTTASALAVDSHGNAYLATTVFPSSSFPTTPAAYQPKSSSAAITGLIAKISADGSALLYSTYLGGTQSDGNHGGDSALGIAVDAAGNAYVTGSTSSPNFPITPGAFQSHIGGQIPTAFVAELSSDGSRLVYSTILGGTGLDSGNQIKVDAHGSAYVLGTTGSKDFPITPGAFQSNIAGALWSPGSGFQSPFVAKLSADGTALEYATYFGGATALDLDSNGNAYILGQATAGFPVTSGAFQRCLNGGGVDLFAAQLTADGKLAGATYLGGSGSESPVGIAAASDGRPWVAATTNSADFPGLIGTVQPQPLLVAEKVAINDTQKQNGPCIALTIQNGASFVEGPIAPGEFVTIRGSGIGPDTSASPLIGPDGKLSTQLAGVQVLMNGIPAPLLYVQSQQINAQVPWETAGPMFPLFSAGVSVEVIYNGAGTNSISVPVVTASPGVFYLDFTALQPAILNSDNTVNTFENPAPRGSVISIYATGGGILAPAGVDGGFWPLSPLSVLSAPASVLIGGVGAQVLYAGSAPGLLSGVLQINARVPDHVNCCLSPPEVGVADVIVQIGNVGSSRVSIAIK
jgi:uncharacterized protein (TIGR03437 family)